MPDATLADFTALVHRVHLGEFPVMPQPTWGQDAAYLGALIDAMWTENERMRKALGRLLDALWDEFGDDLLEATDAIDFGYAHCCALLQRSLRPPHNAPKEATDG